MKGGSKYQPLFEYLRQSSEQVVTLTIDEIEVILKNSLPSSARQSRGWWGNRTKGALQATAWMEAGYIVEKIDLPEQQITFRKPPTHYDVKREGDTILWNSELIKALRNHMGLTQAEMADKLGVRQQTISEWETSSYTPTRASSKHLTLVAENANFKYIQTTDDGDA